MSTCCGTAAVAAEKAKPDRGSVAEFDLAFSVPKSVSVLWALADGPSQQRIVAAHHAAIVTVANRVQAADRRWRTLDSEGLHAAAVAHSTPTTRCWPITSPARWDCRGRRGSHGLARLPGLRNRELLPGQ